jgi:excisionase family DNA binding protein
MSFRPAPQRTPPIAGEWLTLGQAARFLGVAQSTIRKWSDSGMVPAFYTPGGHRRFRRVDLETFIDKSGPSHRRPGPLVLVVDDDARLGELIRVNLEDAGYSVSQAENAAAAIGEIEGRAPRLVLLDAVMPGADGWELLRRLEERHGSIPVVMYSGRVDDPGELVARTRQLIPL